MDCGEGKGMFLLLRRAWRRERGGLTHRYAHAYIWVLTKHNTLRKNPNKKASYLRLARFQIGYFL